jgi:sugar-phosphatase
VTALRVAALLLDLDGTLVDSEPLHRERYRTWFARRGWTYDDVVAAQFTGRRADDVFRTVDGPWRGEDPDALLAEIVALEPHRRLPEPVAGAREAIAWARELGIPLALVTSATTRWASRALEVVGGIEAFDATVTRDDIATGKPDPACYALACERLGVAPGLALACEDAPDGVRSAAAARVGVVVGVTTSFTERVLRDAGATITVPDLTTLPALLTARE